MIKIASRYNFFVDTLQIFWRPINGFQRNCSRDTIGKDEGKEKKEVENVRKGILHDKQKSVQEESYFHKEESEQLKQLKKKLQKDKSVEKKD